MELNKLYDLAEKENIKIYDWQIEDCNGIYLNYDKINAIALDYDQFGTYIEEKYTLAHELGHYFTDSVYPLQCKNKTLIDKAEYKSNNWAYSILVPIKILQEKISKGLNLYELSDYFGVSCEFMQNAIDFYKRKYGFIY